MREEPMVGQRNNEEEQKRRRQQHDDGRAEINQPDLPARLFQSLLNKVPVAALSRGAFLRRTTGKCASCHDGSPLLSLSVPTSYYRRIGGAVSFQIGRFGVENWHTRKRTRRMTTLTPHRWRSNFRCFTMLRGSCFATLLLVAACVGRTVAMAAPPKLPHANPADAGMDAAALAKIDGLVESSLAAHNMPGCVVAIEGASAQIVLQAYGKRRRLEPVPLLTARRYLTLHRSLNRPLPRRASPGWLSMAA